MRILIASKFFYMRGGAELVAINTRRMLQEHGHDVRVLAMSYPENMQLPEQDGFPSEVCLFGSLADRLRGARRMLGVGDVRKCVHQALDEFKPDVVHMHNVHSYLSPYVAEAAKKRGVRVVWTLHDYKAVCPSYSCRRPDGTICEECFTRPGAVLRHRCMKGSLPASVMAYIEARRWSRRRLERCVDTYIAPSAFMAEKMEQAGFDRRKIEVLCNFADPDKLATLASAPPAGPAGEPYFCYIGRLSYEKGVETMLQAAVQAGVSLKVAGRGPLLETLRDRYGSRPGVEFLGHLDAPDVAVLLRGAVASVLPSEWYENNPLGVIESLSAGTPVIGARMGGIPELIEEPKDGFTYPAFDVPALAEAMTRLLDTAFDRADMKRRAAARFGQAAHYARLISIYKSR